MKLQSLFFLMLLYAIGIAGMEKEQQYKKADELIALVKAKDEKKLIEKLKTIDANIFDKNGDTPLHYAAARHNVPIMKILLANKAHVNAQNRDAITPLHNVTYAPFYHGYSIERDREYRAAYHLLIEHGANPMIGDNLGTLPDVLEDPDTAAKMREFMSKHISKQMNEKK